jgi:hypothetical protein
MHQGPYDSRPTFPPPAIEGWGWGAGRAASAYLRWDQVASGEWYAFYCNVGPGRSWGEEHPDDPNWWYNREHRNNPGELVCRHGQLLGNCPDGSCGPAPGPVPTEEEVQAAAARTLRMLKDLTDAQG